MALSFVFRWLSINRFPSRTKSTTSGTVRFPYLSNNRKLSNVPLDQMTILRLKILGLEDLTEDNSLLQRLGILQELCIGIHFFGAQ